MKQLISKLTFGFALILGSMEVNGQPGGGGPGGGQTPADVPISGIEFIIGGGMIYGFRKIYQAQKRK